MRPIAEVLIPVFLVGCLVAAVAVAEEQECESPYKGRTLTPEELETVLHYHQTWLEALEAGVTPNDERRANLCQAVLEEANLQRARLEGADLQGARLFWANLQGARLQRAILQEADLNRADLQGARLFQANLQGARLEGANLQRAHLDEANLQEANLNGADLQGAFLRVADLRGADLGEANLQEANLNGADLQRARLQGANLQEVNLTWVDLQGAVYEPNPGKLPNFWTLTDPRNHLEMLVFHWSPAGLIALREAFKKGGMRTQERQITYAIEHTKRHRAWDPSWRNPFAGKDNRPWLEKLAGKGESLFSYVLFDLPSRYGMAPGRALWGLLGFIPIFALFYWIALQHVKSYSGLWMVVPKDRIAPGRGKEKIVRISRHPTKTWHQFLRGESRLVCTSLYFSLLSAFHLGWRELNVGTWIARMQPREYTLRATGWVRTVSGIQSLLSVYLLALWVLTYFGRPFE